MTLPAGVSTPIASASVPTTRASSSRTTSSSPRRGSTASTTSRWNCAPPTARRSSPGSCPRAARRGRPCSISTAMPRTSAPISPTSRGCRRRGSTCWRSTIEATAARKAARRWVGCSLTSTRQCARSSGGPTSIRTASSSSDRAWAARWPFTMSRTAPTGTISLQ